LALRDELTAQVEEFLTQRWGTREGRVIPSTDDLGLDNEAVEFKEATVLYSDLSDSTRMVDRYSWSFAAEIYKSFLYCAARTITSEGGTVTAYDGDRIMAVFIGDSKNTAAARTALKINYCAKKIVNPLLKKHYPKSDYQIRHVTGIDTSMLRAARTGARGANDLVWVGRAANYAAKLATLSDDYATRCTEAVHERLRDELKTTDGQAMWTSATWNAMNNMQIYRSTWWWLA
jgi:class 3 adenylate cyclase